MKRTASVKKSRCELHDPSIYRVHLAFIAKACLVKRREFVKLILVLSTWIKINPP